MPADDRRTRRPERLGALPGIVAGSYASGRIPEPALRLALAAVLVLIGDKLVF